MEGWQSSVTLMMEVEGSSDRVMCIVIYDSSGRAIQVLILVYMAFYQRGNSEQTEQFVETLDEYPSLT